MSDKAFELDPVPPEMRQAMLEERRAYMRGTVQRHRQRLKEAGHVSHHFTLSREITERVIRFQESRQIRIRRVALQMLIEGALDVFDTQEEEKP